MSGTLATRPAASEALAADGAPRLACAAPLPAVAGKGALLIIAVKAAAAAFIDGAAEALMPPCLSRDDSRCFDGLRTHARVSEDAARSDAGLAAAASGGVPAFSSADGRLALAIVGEMVSSCAASAADASKDAACCGGSIGRSASAAAAGSRATAAKAANEGSGGDADEGGCGGGGGDAARGGGACDDGACMVGGGAKGGGGTMLTRAMCAAADDDTSADVPAGSGPCPRSIGGPRGGANIGGGAGCLGEATRDGSRVEAAELFREGRCCDRTAPGSRSTAAVESSPPSLLAAADSGGSGGGALADVG